MILRPAQSLLIPLPIMVTHPSILLIEDSPGERELFRLALAQTGLDVALFTEQDAETALHFLKNRMHRSPQYSFCEAADGISTARIERGPSEAARSASTETMPVAPLSSAPIQEGDMNWSSPARIEGAHSDRAASASKEGQAGCPPTLPSLNLLDWHLGKQRGDEFLKRLRADHRFAAIPVVVFTTSDDASDLSLAYTSGANGYVVKPGTFAELIQCAGDMCRYWLDRNRVPHMIGTTC